MHLFTVFFVVYYLNIITILLGFPMLLNLIFLILVKALATSSNQQSATWVKFTCYRSGPSLEKQLKT